MASENHMRNSPHWTKDAGIVLISDFARSAVFSHGQVRST